MLIFLDLQTTGLQIDDKIVSIGLIAVDGDKITTKYDLLNEGKKISSEISSINHITNEMLKDKPNVQDSEIYKFLKEQNNETNTLIAHNVKFDLQMLSASGIQWLGNIVDTLRVTKHLIPECERFSLQFLRYELKLYTKEKNMAVECGINTNITAHNSLADSLVIKLLYKYLLENSSLEQMMELSFKNVLMQKLDFGKYEGKYIEDIVINDVGYLQWMLANVLDLDEDLRYSINYYLQG